MPVAEVMVEVRCGRGHYLVTIPAGTRYSAYCHRCQKTEAAKAR